MLAGFQPSRTCFLSVVLTFLGLSVFLLPCKLDVLVTSSGATGVLVVDAVDESEKFATLAKLNDLMHVDGVQFAAGTSVLTITSWQDAGKACGAAAQEVVSWMNARLGPSCHPPLFRYPSTARPGAFYF